MDAQFERYFSDRLDQIRQESHPLGIQFPSAQMSSWSDPTIYDDAVREAIQSSQRIDRGGLRPDGELLLYLAFTELVARPISAVRGSSIPDVQGGIVRDIDLITLQARGSRRPGIAISAHDIVDATTQNWSRLRSAQWNLWD